MTKKLSIPSGERFFRLTVVEEVAKSKDGRRKFKMLCDCGNTSIVELGRLTAGKTKSCGCLRKEGARPTHNKTGTKVYRAWQSMRNRCNKPSTIYYEDYGGRGIKVCGRWDESFINFYEDVGEPPTEKHSLDRLDVDGDYCPENVVWATPAAQGRNRRMARNNSSGVTGVVVKQVGKTTYYMAIWKNLDCTEGRKYFSAKKHGHELAMFMATELRAQQINLLNLMGAGYSRKHGL